MPEPVPPAALSPGSARIEVRHTLDAAYWCRVFGVNHRQLCHAVQHVGPQVAAVRRYLNAPEPASHWIEDSGF